MADSQTRVRELEAANAALRDRIMVLRDALLPFARVGASVTDEQAEADVWLARARRAHEVCHGNRVTERAA